MKKLLLIMFVCSTVYGADIIPSLTISDHTYTNLRVVQKTATYIVVLDDGGGFRVALSNLPPDLQQKYHYNPESAARQDATDAQKKLEVKQQYEKYAVAIAKAKATLGPQQKIRLLKAFNSAEFQIAYNGTLVEAYIHNVPYDVFNFIQDLTRTQAEVDATQNENAYAPLYNTD